MFKTAPDEHVVSVEHITHVEEEGDDTGEAGEGGASENGDGEV